MTSKHHHCPLNLLLKIQSQSFCWTQSDLFLLLSSVPTGSRPAQTSTRTPLLLTRVHWVSVHMRPKSRVDVINSLTLLVKSRDSESNDEQMSYLNYCNLLYYVVICKSSLVPYIMYTVLTIDHNTIRNNNNTSSTDDVLIYIQFTKDNSYVELV